MTEQGFKRKLTAILSADAVGYSRLMGEDEEATVRTITAYREVITNLIEKYNGSGKLTLKTFLRHRKSPFLRFHIENVCNSGVLLILLITKRD